MIYLPPLSPSPFIEGYSLLLKSGSICANFGSHVNNFRPREVCLNHKRCVQALSPMAPQQGSWLGLHCSFMETCGVSIFMDFLSSYCPLKLYSKFELSNLIHGGQCTLLTDNSYSAEEQEKVKGYLLVKVPFGAILEVSLVI